MNRRVTICDIAEAAGVSACCVSWVLRNHPRSQGMNVKTRQRILDAAASLGYVQNQLAIATRTGHVNTIAVILNFRQFQNQPPVNQIMTGILLESSAFRQSIKIFSEEDLDNSFRQILENRIDKIIMISIDHDLRERVAELAEQNSIRLAYAYECGHRNFPAVNADNIEMTSKMVHYLAEHGHSRIGLLCVPHIHHYKTDRHAGYLKGMTECGLKTDPRWISCSGEIDAAVDRMLALPPEQRPTALVTLSDSLAARAQRQAWKRGLRIPEDFSVIGIGDMECSSLSMIPITTFRESLTETGSLLVHLVLGKKIDIQPDESQVFRTHAELIERESVYPIDARRKSQAPSYKIQEKKQKGPAK